jgi:type VI protein secretion system component Hcp
MTTHSTIKTVLRALVASLFAAGLSAMWPLSAQAGKSGGGGGHVQTHDISVTKTVDKASPNLYRAAAKGRHFDEVTITTRKSGAQKTGDKPTENIHLNYDKVEWKY